jgi:hypothetical protein
MDVDQKQEGIDTARRSSIEKKPVMASQLEPPGPLAFSRLPEEIIEQ